MKNILKNKVYCFLTTDYYEGIMYNISKCYFTGTFFSLWGKCIVFAVNGRIHRLDGPAIIAKNGRKEWYINGKLHREDGPAKEYRDGHKEWYLNGNPLTKYQFDTRNRKYLNDSFYEKDY